jgi:hypothetical protein
MKRQELSENELKRHLHMLSESEIRFSPDGQTRCNSVAKEMAVCQAAVFITDQQISPSGNRILDIADESLGAEFATNRTNVFYAEMSGVDGQGTTHASSIGGSAELASHDSTGRSTNQGTHARSMAASAGVGLSVAELMDAMSRMFGEPTSEPQGGPSSLSSAPSDAK